MPLEGVGSVFRIGVAAAMTSPFFPFTNRMEWKEALRNNKGRGDPFIMDKLLEGIGVAREARSAGRSEFI